MIDIKWFLVIMKLLHSRRYLPDGSIMQVHCGPMSVEERSLKNLDEKRS